MELIAAGRLLWARKSLLAVGILVAVSIAVLMTYSVKLGLPPKLHSKDYYVGEASAQVLIDTQTSQTADLSGPNDLSALYSRASLLADIIATAPIEQAIAQKLGISPQDLSVTPPPSSIGTPLVATSLAVAGTKTANASPTWNLSVTVDANLPIIAFRAVAPTPQKAQSLTSAAIAVMSDRQDAIAVSQKVPARGRLVVNVIDPPIAGAVPRGPHKLFGIAAGAVALFLFCVAVVLHPVLRRRRAAQLASAPESAVTTGAEGDHAEPGARPESSPFLRSHARSHPYSDDEALGKMHRDPHPVGAD